MSLIPRKNLTESIKMSPKMSLKMSPKVSIKKLLNENGFENRQELC